MDLVWVSGQQFIVKFKLWYGSKDHHKAYMQLLGYIDNHGTKIGYLITFGKKKKGTEWITIGDKQTFDVVV